MCQRTLPGVLHLTSFTAKEMQVYHVTLCRVNRDAVQTQNQAFRASVARLSILQAQDGTMQTNLPPRAALMPSLQSVAAVAAYLAWWPHPSLKLHMDGQRCSTRKACVESPLRTRCGGEVGRWGPTTRHQSPSWRAARPAWLSIRMALPKRWNSPRDSSSRLPK